MNLNDLTFAEYRAFDAVSQSDLKFAKSEPQLYYEMHIARTRAVDSPSDSMRWGTACEAYIRAGGKLEGVTVIPESALNAQGHRRGKQWTEFAERHEGEQLVTQREFELLERDLRSAWANIVASDCAMKIIGNPGRQWSARHVWTCSETAMTLKCEMDLLLADLKIVCDIKTAADTKPDMFARSAFNFGYHIQAAMYLEAARDLLAVDCDFVWIVIRNRPPFNVEVYAASPQLLERGRQDLSDAKRWYKQCKESGKWQTETSGTVTLLNLPKWV